MHQETLEFLAKAVKTLNELHKDDEDNSLIPYLGTIPVVLDGVLIGHLRDEIGVSWAYYDLPASEQHEYEA